MSDFNTAQQLRLLRQEVDTLKAKVGDKTLVRGGGGGAGGSSKDLGCVCVATSSITLSGNQTIDGVATGTNQVCVTGNGSSNGIYTAGSGAWVRKYAFGGSTGLKIGTVIGIGGGTTRGKTAYIVTGADTAQGMGAYLV